MRYGYREKNKTFVVPTKLAVSLVYNIGPTDRMDNCRQKEPQEIILPEDSCTLNEIQFIPALSFVKDNTGKAGELQKNNPVLQDIKNYRPYTKDLVLSQEEGALYIFFPKSKAEITQEFRNNNKVLDQIIDITKAIMKDYCSKQHSLCCITRPCAIWCSVLEIKHQMLKYFARRQCKSKN